MADAIIHMDGVRSPVLVKGGEGPRGVAGPTGAVEIGDLPITVVSIDDFNDGDANTAAINAALADAEAAIVMLPAGTIIVGSPIIGQSHRILSGAGMGRTIIKAADPFTYGVTAATGGPANAPIFAESKTGFYVTDLTVDVSKAGLPLFPAGRVNGHYFLDCTYFGCARVTVRDVTGYSFWAAGSTGANRSRYGTFVDCWSFNANVHFEQTRAEEIDCVRCHARAGDGDISCEAMFHPLVLSKNIRFIDCTGLSNGTGLLVVSSTGPMDNITVRGCRIVSQNFYAIVLEDNGQPGNVITGIKLSDSHFETLDWEGCFLNTSGPGAPFLADNCTFKCTGGGLAIAIGLVRSAGSRFSNCEAIAIATDALGGATAISNQDSVGTGLEPVYFDGRLSATPGSGGVAAAIGSPLNVVVSRTSVLAPNPHKQIAIEDWGSVLSGNGGTGIVAITLGVTAIDEDKAHLDLSLKKGSALGNEWSYNWTVLEGTGFVTVYTEGLPNGETLRWHYVETA